MNAHMHVRVRVVGDVDVDVVVDWARTCKHDWQRMYLCHSANAIGFGRHM